MENLTNYRSDVKLNNRAEPFMIERPGAPIERELKKFPVVPNKWEAQFQPELGFFASIFRSLREKATADAERAFQDAYERWEEDHRNVILHNELVRMEYKRALEIYRNDVAVWDMKKAEHLRKQHLKEVEYDTGY